MPPRVIDHYSHLLFKHRATDSWMQVKSSTSVIVGEPIGFHRPTRTKSSGGPTTGWTPTRTATRGMPRMTSHAKTYARIYSPDGELQLAKRGFEELRMTLGAVCTNHGAYPPQGHPRETVRKVWEFSTDLSDHAPGRGSAGL